MRAMNRPSLPKSLLRRIIPFVLRRRLGDRLRRANLRPYSERPRIPEDAAQALRERYRSDVMQLQTLIDRDLGTWLPGER
jgi:hypothetical protein